MQEVYPERNSDRHSASSELVSSIIGLSRTGNVLHDPTSHNSNCLGLMVSFWCDADPHIDFSYQKGTVQAGDGFIMVSGGSTRFGFGRLARLNTSLTGDHYIALHCQPFAPIHGLYIPHCPVSGAENTPNPSAAEQLLLDYFKRLTL